MKYALIISFLLSTVWISTSIADEATKKLDNHGHIIQQTDPDGRKILHTYSANGNKIKTESNDGRQAFFDKPGQRTGKPAILSK